jgi:hypothetical protein
METSNSALAVAIANLADAGITFEIVCQGDEAQCPHRVGPLAA